MYVPRVARGASLHEKAPDTKGYNQIVSNDSELDIDQYDFGEEQTEEAKNATL